MLKKIGIGIFFLLVGAASAVGLMILVGNSPFGRFDQPLLTTFGVEKPEIVGFLPYWLIGKADKDYSQYITTLTYFGLAMGNDGSIQKLVAPGEEEPGWTTLRTGKYDPMLTMAKKYNLKSSLLVISGDDDVIGQAISDPVKSATNLVTDVAPIMKDKGFTDLNLDIESFMDASPSARANFTSFVRTVKEQMTAQHLGTVTLDLIPIALVEPKLYDARALGAIVDRVVLMTYDYHYLGSLVTGANAPVGGAGVSIEYDTETAVKEALKRMPADKVLLGIPLYGYEWETIKNASGSATIPGGGSTASVRRVSEILSSCATCSASFDAVAREPYLIYPENDYFNQIYYENAQSMGDKIALAQKYRLGGVALWALGYEDNEILAPLTSYKNTLDLTGLY